VISLEGDVPGGPEELAVLRAETKRDVGEAKNREFAFRLGMGRKGHFTASKKSEILMLGGGM